MNKYVTGKFPNTVINKETGTLYVRKSIGKKQIWRKCEPPTAARAEEILLEIEAELLGDKRIALIYLKTRKGLLSFEEFKGLYNAKQNL